MDKPSPVHVTGHKDEKLSRGLWLIKWLLLIPHFIVLAILGCVSIILTIIAFFAILFTEKYPRPIFDFNVAVMRWAWRVGFYSYHALGTDKYPPFSLEDDGTYPARLEVDYPEHLSRWLIFVKWILAIPHLVIIALFGNLSLRFMDITTHMTSSMNVGLIVILVFFAGVVLLFKGYYPKSIFTLVMGLNRWIYRVLAYVLLMTDNYPPFRLDQGEEEPKAEQALHPNDTIP